MKLVSPVETHPTKKIGDEIKTFHFLPNEPTEANGELEEAYFNALVNTYPERYSIVDENKKEEVPETPETPVVDPVVPETTPEPVDQVTLDEKVALANIPSEEEFQDEVKWSLDALKGYAKELGIAGWATTTKRDTLIQKLLALKED